MRPWLLISLRTPTPGDDVCGGSSWCGEIYVDGTALLNYPATELLDYGAHDVQAVGLDQWHVFTGWSSTGPQVAPSMANAAGSISVTEPATYTAHFNVIEHSDLKVRVEPPNKGVVRIEGGAVIVTDEWEGGLEISGLLNAEAAPVEHWAFDRWEIANAAPNPSATSANITLPKQDEEELVAYFVPIDFAVYVPTAFSPNNDGLNDAFMPVGTSFVAETYHLIVINRWGEKVFESFDPKEPWIGSTKAAITSSAMASTCTDWKFSRCTRWCRGAIQAA